MAQFPDYVRVLLSGAGEEFDPAVVRADMERGLPKQRLQSRRVIVRVDCTLFFASRADTLAFDDWYFGAINRIGWFNWRDPRAGVTRSVRFAGGSIGKLTPLAARYEVAQRSCTLEYLR